MQASLGRQRSNRTTSRRIAIVKNTMSILAVCLALTFGSYGFAKQPAPAGTLIIIGGALRFDNTDVWNRIVEQAAAAREHTVSTSKPGEDYRPRIAVFPTASGDPEQSGRITAEALNSYGADAFVVPVALSKMEMDARDAVVDPKLIEQVTRADGVYFTGGQQARIVEALRTPEGADTPMLQAVWAVYNRGGVVAGTSAGAAVMSRIMYRDAKHVLPTLQQGVTMGREVDYGLGFLDPSWFVEQHTLVRGRFARALVAMQAHGIQFGVGIDENTAIVVKDDQMEVVGYKGAIVMDLSEAKEDPQVKGFNVQNVKLTYLDHGDKLKLDTREVTPSQKKQEGTKLDPNSPEYRPTDDEHIFSADILGNATAVDMMWKLLGNRDGEALGLAFDAEQALAESTPGFEFRFYRGDDTIGWSTYARGDETYTVSNVHLDIRPVNIGPLYK
jgi:cyanophycinase